ncbi:membrane protein [Marinithermofilum abyssi]|uniref:Membrane protein n=1 Tax=Marinithermofilum abyssi TaxID=1571185 RepID=A0A8J2Y9I9_9BACL|nr:Bax inhibitor-1/YccA family protein [Marinithermofilum abyssi]GGE24004.1 membrane protein [Marinithermofilum abyssi]
MDTSVSRVATQQRLLPRVFSWMFAGLSMTAIISLILSADDRLLYVFEENMGIFYGLLIAEFLLVFFISARIQKMAPGTATFLFFLYSALNGVTLTPLLLVYTSASVAGTFVVTAGMFGLFALYGAKTNKDLSKLGSLFLMALIGLILATIVNIFMANSVLYWIITYVGVILFCGLTAYDVQRIKAMEAYQVDEDEHTKLAIYGALGLYINFINIFIYLLRIFGSRD